MPKPALDPSIIESAPVSTEIVGTDPDYVVELEGILVEVQSELEDKIAELNRLQGKKTVDDVKAEILADYTNAVFRFVRAYCVVVAIFLALAAWKAHTGFQLSDTILSIIAGSTAVSVIGLIGMVISGLFGGVRQQRVSGNRKAKPKRP